MVNRTATASGLRTLRTTTGSGQVDDNHDSPMSSFKVAIASSQTLIMCSRDPFTSFRACPEPVEGAGSSRAPFDRQRGRPRRALDDIPPAKARSGNWLCGCGVRGVTLRAEQVTPWPRVPEPWGTRGDIMLTQTRPCTPGEGGRLAFRGGSLVLRVVGQPC